MGVTKKTLLGKELIFTEEMDLFNSLRKKYILLSREARQKAEEEYNGNITGYSEYRSYTSFLSNISRLVYMIS